MPKKPAPPPEAPKRRNERELFEPHAKRKLRAFLIEPDRGNHNDTRTFDAFWALIYGYVVVDHATARAVELECMASTVTVGDVLAGWRPAALSSATPEEGKP